MPHQKEPNTNNALGRLLQRMLPGCEVMAEHTRVIDGHPGSTPDILITAAGRSPVVIEAEYDPARDVETEACGRLGLETAARLIEAAIALRYPAALKQAADLDAALDAARLSYCVFTQEGKRTVRFPTSGWLDGSIEDIADLNRLVSVPQGAVDVAARELEAGIDRATAILEETVKLRPSIGFAIARLLGMTNVRQTWRMAGAIIANALIFHERLAGMHPGVKPLELLRSQAHSDLKRETVAAWSKILDINDWPIFGVARDIISQLESLDAARILRTLRGTATQIRASGVDNAHDLTGRVFQRLIADRKYLATFYTLPASAALLARLAVAKLDGVEWSDPDAIGKLRVADFACGTGALLSAVYEQVAARHERTGSTGEETAAQIAADIPHESFDLVIMNPPFTRATNHEGAHADVLNPAFAAFGATEDDMDAMGKRLNKKGQGTAYHGNAGVASAFAALAHDKLRPGGVLALVLPLSAASGLAWKGFRRMLARDYADLAVLSIAASDNDDLSFSADTGLAECLVIARKCRIGEPPAARLHFSSLALRPQGFAHASAIARCILAGGGVRRVEDGPYGGTPLQVGDEKSGVMLTAPAGTDGAAWSGVRLADYSLAQTAYALAASQLWLPGWSAPLHISVVPLGITGKLGLVDRDITGPRPRGPFDKTTPEPTATYPSLWNHDAYKETRLVCAPDSQLLVRIGMEVKAQTVWATASRSHISRGFRFTSQPLMAAFTDSESIGGRGWPNVKFNDSRFDYAFTVWGNSSLGLLCYWWHSNRQVAGRGDISIRALETLHVLDLRTLSEEQLTTAEVIFEEFRDKELKPAYLADADPNRALLDRYVVCDLLGFDQTVYEGVRRLAAKWCAEPSVHGGKPRPRGSKLFI